MISRGEMPTGEDVHGRDYFTPVFLLPQLCNSTSEEGVNLLVLEPELDTSSSNGKLMVHVLASLAEWERDLLRERTKDGVAYARSQGRYPGRKPKMSPEQAHTAQRLIEDGHSYSAVARGFNVSRPTLYRALERAKKAQRESATP